MNAMTTGPGGPHRTRRGTAIVMAGVAGLTLMACTRPGGPAGDPGATAPVTTGPSPSDPPPSGVCRRIDFDTAVVSGAPSSSDQAHYRLTVTGTRPSANISVSLRPVTYIRQPEYWQIEVIGCGVLGDGRPAPYTVSRDVTATMGTRGINVAGAVRSQNIDVVTPAFVGSWTVTGVTGGDTGAIVPVPAGGITLLLGQKRVVTGRVCNTYRASWSGSGRSLAITGVTRTSTLPCPSGPSELEIRYLAALERVGTWHLDAGRLVLVDAAGTDLVTAERATAEVPAS
jgi:hypothetical protein